ncbi:uncharacterized protein SCHCODRAFT_02093218 [Schizophyllum commune H4-8]|uniref:uncharacterized protein n=1 Tax=Schizophyllum commune (strain H4-8 / FGSC 9210) TaxID=578458 RepID=UPI0021610AC6|nr:uncharacterized protein SCHCODRAFT_02093218 [Schizophyllum commune H4-8]KAI5887306.1 hypothetical protein SCHCODRAFT_02093218 [Schizophyllum commune H4-8]
MQPDAIWTPRTSMEIKRCGWRWSRGTSGDKRADTNIEALEKIIVWSALRRPRTARGWASAAVEARNQRGYRERGGATSGLAGSVTTTYVGSMSNFKLGPVIRACATGVARSWLAVRAWAGHMHGTY